MRQAGEPSVEEILESIKKVIARDNRAEAEHIRRRREEDGMVTTRTLRAEDLPDDPQPVFQVPVDQARTILALQPQSLAEDEPAPVLDLTDAEMADAEMADAEMADAKIAGDPSGGAEADFGADDDYELADEASAEELMNEHETAAETPLLAESARASMRESLTALAMLAEPGARPQIVRSGETSLEGLTRDLLRPMLGEWLEKTLPPLVDKMVAAEIARIVGKRA